MNKTAIAVLFCCCAACAQCKPQPKWLPTVAWKVHAPIVETLAPGASVIAAAAVPKSRVGAAVLHVKADYPVSVWFGSGHLCAVTDRAAGTAGCALPSGAGPLIIKDDRGAAATAGNDVAVSWATLVLAVGAAQPDAAVSRSRIGQPETAVPPGKYVYYTVEVPAGDTAYIGGTFRAEGGSGNDIDVYLVNDDGLLNLLNGHGFRSYFATASPETAGQMNVGPLGPGSYYLVFDNAFSAVSNKVVTSEIELVLNAHSN